MDYLLDTFGLTAEQRRAAAQRQRNLAVTAGAGSGKTRTLVARYLGLLGEDLRPRQVVAITFTEKAAREMRSRARQSLRQLVVAAKTAAERQRWAILDAQMDSARIGTIHSLCAEILRSHPAEAALDPQFRVVEDNQAAALRHAAVQAGVAWAVQQPEMGALLRSFSLNLLERVLSTLLAKRLEVSSASFEPAGLAEQVRQALLSFLQDKLTAGILDELRQAQASHNLAEEAGEGMASQALYLLAAFDQAAAALSPTESEPTDAALALFQARRSSMRLNVGKRSSAIKDAMRALRDHYDSVLAPWLGGANAKDPPPDPLVETALLETAPLVEQVFKQVLAVYRTALDEQSGLDFDDLEAGAVALLRIPAIRAYWQQETAAVLVDEFQDTNARQREIILALCGEQPGRLFVVGDARQSIYRFRGADVTVFTGLQDEIKRQGGLAIDLERTFRAHPELLQAAGALLAGIMGIEPDPQRPYHIPYAPLVSERRTARPGMQAPFVECILAAGEGAAAARPAAAQALARRLVELKNAGEIRAWDEVALLFRASTTFPLYEQALEDCGIPFVTVAGSGFYDRPEVRDLLNILRALADPWDDQALAGLLRSPAFGVSDVGLYRLRWAGGEARSLFEALHGDLRILSAAGEGVANDEAHARRAAAIIAELQPWVDRLPVAELLERIVNRCDYRATLASCAGLPGSARLWRNVDKLISDARASGQVRVRAFLEYVASMRDVGARESEAASEAAGALRLMTIHKSKGLEFPIVVLADAARRPNQTKDSAYRLGQAWTFALDKLEAAPLAYRLASVLDGDQSAAEEQRLLYVAMTRAQEKLIVSGHLTVRETGVYANGWLGDLLAAGGILPGSLLDHPGAWQSCSLPDGAAWNLWLAPLEPEGLPPEAQPVPAWPETSGEPLYTLPPARPDEPSFRQPHRLILFQPRTPPARVVGEMVHKALQRWRFPGDPRLDPLLRTQAQVAGLLDDSLVEHAVQAAENLLHRFQRQPLYAEMDVALERHHELPYVESAVEWGFIDCLYRTPQGWVLVDFKTDELRTSQAVEAAVEEYRPQLLRYRQAAERLLGEAPQTRMCFLNVGKEVEVRDVRSG